MTAGSHHILDPFADEPPPEVLEQGLRAAIGELECSSFAAHLLDAAPVQILVLDRTLTVRWVNAGFARARNISAMDAVGVPVANFFGDLTSKRVQFERALHGEDAHWLMRTSALPDQTVRDVNIYIRPLRAPGVPAVCGVSMYVGDLRVLPADQPDVPSSAQVLRQVFGLLPNFVLILDRELKVLFANRGMAQRSAEELEGQYIAEIFPPKLRPLALAVLRRVLASGQLDGFTAEIDGDLQRRHFDVQVAAVQVAGDVLALTVVGTEITQQVRAERAIATQARMIESMLEGVAVINEQNIVEITNPAFDRMFGYERGDLIGRDMVELTGGAFSDHGRWPLGDGEASSRLEFEAPRRDGSTFAASGVLSRFEIAGRNHALLVLQDISERKQLERAILQAVSREQYRIGNDLHDGLGQELTGIALMLRGVAGRLTTEYPAILPEVEGITKLVSNAIESTRALARGLSPVNLERGGLRDALEGLAMSALELYGVQVIFSHRLPGAKSNSTDESVDDSIGMGAELANHLYRIAQEAVRNAAQHGKARTIRLHLSMVRGKVRLAITDDGIGLPEGAMDTSGMGLKIMRYRARMLGGEVQFERVEPTGTRVVCECPMTHNPSHARSKSRRTARPRSKLSPGGTQQ